MKTVRVHRGATTPIAILLSAMIATMAGCGSPIRYVKPTPGTAAATSSSNATVPPGTVIPVTSVVEIASRAGTSAGPTNQGQEQSFIVAQDVVNSQGSVVVKKDTPVLATTTLQQHRRIGRPGFISISFKSTTAANGTVVRLDDSPQRFEGQNRLGGSIALAFFTMGLGLLRTGGDVTLPKGSGLTASVVP